MQMKTRIILSNKEINSSELATLTISNVTVDMIINDVVDREKRRTAVAPKSNKPASK